MILKAYDAPPLPILLHVDKKKWGRKAGRIVEFTADYTVHIGLKIEGEIIGDITIPRGFLSDGASVPPFLWSLIGPPIGEFVLEACVHDYLYYVGVHTRKTCDIVFRKLLARGGVSLWRRRLIYRGVRWGGWYGWKKHRANNTAQGKSDVAMAGLGPTEKIT